MPLSLHWYSLCDGIWSGSEPKEIANMISLNVNNVREHYIITIVVNSYVL